MRYRLGLGASDKERGRNVNFKLGETTAVHREGVATAPQVPDPAKRPVKPLCRARITGILKPSLKLRLR